MSGDFAGLDSGSGPRGAERSGKKNAVDRSDLIKRPRKCKTMIMVEIPVLHFLQAT